MDPSSANDLQDELPESSNSPVLESLGIREVEDRQGNESVVQLVAHICRIYGIDLTSLEDREGPSVRASTSSASSEHGHCDTIEQHGWPELQVGVVREAVAIAEALPGEYCPLTHQCLTACKCW